MVVTALPARLAAVPYENVIGQWAVVVDLLAGSLIGAWIGASGATRMRSTTLHRVLAGLLVLIAAALAWDHVVQLTAVTHLDPVLRIILGVAAGLGVGIVAALLGVAGGELLIPTVVLLFAVDIKTAGSLSLAISLPTMMVAFARYSRDRSFGTLRSNQHFVFDCPPSDVRGQGLAPPLAVELAGCRFSPGLVVGKVDRRPATGTPTRRQALKSSTTRSPTTSIRPGSPPQQPRSTV